MSVPHYRRRDRARDSAPTPARIVTDEERSLDDDRDIDINLRAPDIVAARVVVLASLCRYVALLAQTVPRPTADEIAAERFDLRSWLQLEHLSDELAPSERRFLDSNQASLAPSEISAMTWRAEALVALGWALSLLPDLAPPYEATDPSPLLDAMPRPFDTTGSFRETASLRNEAEIARERERAELWHWRSDVAALQAVAPANERRDLAALVHDVAREATESGLLNGFGGDDFPVGGRPFLALPAEDREPIAIIAEQRHHALNWLCGFGTSWDNVPLDL